MSESKFSKSMATLPDEGLIRIAFASADDGYVDEAIQAAKLELDRRGVEQNQIQEIVEEYQEDKTFNENIDSVGLSNKGWISFVILSPLIPVAILAALLYTIGYKQKRKEAFHAISVGWAILTCVSMIFTILMAYGV